MSISAVSPQSPVAPPQDFSRQSFGQLVSALRSGNLSAAKCAYSAFTQVAPGQGGGPFTPIGNALQSGDIEKAQQALAALQQQMQAAKGAHHHRGRHDHDSGQAQATALASSTTTSGSTSVSTSDNPTAPTAAVNTNLVNVTA